MKRILYCLMTLLVLGLTTLPCAADENERRAEKHVSTLTEAEMREELRQAREWQVKLERALKTGNYSEVLRDSGSDGTFTGDFYRSFVQANFDYNTALIKALERRLKDFDSKNLEDKKEELKALEKEAARQREFQEQKEALEDKYQNWRQGFNDGHQAIQNENRGQDWNRAGHQDGYGSMPKDRSTKIGRNNSYAGETSTSDVSNRFGNKKTKAEQAEGNKGNPAQGVNLEEMRKRIAQLKKEIEELERQKREKENQENTNSKNNSTYENK